MNPVANAATDSAGAIGALRVGTACGLCPPYFARRGHLLVARRPGQWPAHRPRSEYRPASKIFDWFTDDFAAAGGVLAFAIRYAPEPERSWLSAHGPSARLDYFDYDWALNALPNKVE